MNHMPITQRQHAEMYALARRCAEQGDNQNAACLQRLAANHSRSVRKALHDKTMMTIAQQLGDVGDDHRLRRALRRRLETLRLEYPV